MAERPLNPDEARLWGRVVETVAPLPGRPVPPVLQGKSEKAKPGSPSPIIVLGTPASPIRARKADTLDRSWDRDLKRGAVVPDRTVDLHEQTLAVAHARVDRELDAARNAGERVLLLVTGKARPDARGGNPGGRGAIRALIGDWLAASRHAGAIAAVRPAHPRHGGAGALYVILRRR